MTKRRTALYFISPRKVSLVEENVPVLNNGEALVQTITSAISAGTEMMIYCGYFPKDLTIDSNLPALTGRFAYPFKYGYASVGRVIAVGNEVDPVWQDRLVFAFHPHASHFRTDVEQLHPLPQGVSPEEAVFLANMETALNLVMDGSPLIGERVLVCGQGVVGLLTTALLAGYPLASLISLERHSIRRQVSESLGAQTSLDPATPNSQAIINRHMPDGADLSYELSGSAEALDQVIAWTGFNGRVILGSWYGNQRASLDLGSSFHRSRIQLVSSQVSTIAPHLSGRWTKARRFELAWEMIRQVCPSRLITHKIPFSQAGQAYRLLDGHPEETIQVVFTYS